MKRLAIRLWQTEGFSRLPYQIDGIAHIGVGRNLEMHGLTEKEMHLCGVPESAYMDINASHSGYMQCDYAQAKHLFPDGINKETGIRLLKNDILTAIHDARSFLGPVHFSELSDIQQQALIEMAFNLGLPQLQQFRKLRKALQAPVLDTERIRREAHVKNPDLAKRYQRISSELATSVAEPMEPLDAKLRTLFDTMYGVFSDSAPIIERVSSVPSAAAEETTVFMDVCLDFDGTLAQYLQGWQGIAHTAEPPMPGAMETLKEWKNHRLRVAVFSARSVTSAGIAAMQEWLRRYAPDGEGDAWVRWLFWPKAKPAATIYIDDRGWRPPAGGALPTVEEIKAFRPWYLAL